MTFRSARVKWRACDISTVNSNSWGAYFSTEGRRETMQDVLDIINHKLRGINLGTPSIRRSLAEALGPVCKNEKDSFAMLEGDIKIPGDNEDVALMMSLLHGNCDGYKLDYAVRIDIFICFWKGEDEGKSSSKIGRHFGHCKASFG